MSRRVVVLLALVALAVLGMASLPWTLSGGDLSTAVSGYLEKNYRISLKVDGRGTIAFLPTPRVKFENASLITQDGVAQSEGGTVRAELRLIPMIFGRIELSEVTISDARITASLERLRRLDWAHLLKDSKETPQRIPRLILTSSSIHWMDTQEKLDGVNLLVNWPDRRDVLESAGSVVWRGEPVQVTQASIIPAVLAAEQPAHFVLIAKTPHGSISLNGEAQIGSDPRVTGQSDIKLTSVHDFAQWSGVKLPLSPLVKSASVAGDFSLTRRRLSWPSVEMSLGEDRLDGTLSVQLETERPILSGTLAADRLDLSDFFEPFMQSRNSSGEWKDDRLDLAQATGADLDIRLSATNAKLGLIRFDDMAASILVKPGQVEASLGRASFHEGSLKGRLSLVSHTDGTELKSQATFDGVDISSFLGLIGEPRWIAGRAGGQVQLEATGKSVADLVRHSQGRTTVTVKKGELIGIGLNEVMRRIEKRPLAASLDWRGGRTAFDIAQATMNVASGLGEISEGKLTAPGLRATLHGQISMIERNLDLKIAVDQATPSTMVSPLIVFDVNGGWNAISITPDAKSLIQRSGAAQPLFGPGTPAQNTSAIAIAQ